MLSSPVVLMNFREELDLPTLANVIDVNHSIRSITNIYLVYWKTMVASLTSFDKFNFCETWRVSAKGFSE